MEQLSVANLQEVTSGDFRPKYYEKKKSKKIICLDVTVLI